MAGQTTSASTSALPLPASTSEQTGSLTSSPKRPRIEVCRIKQYIPYSQHWHSHTCLDPGDFDTVACPGEESYSDEEETK